MKRYFRWDDNEYIGGTVYVETEDDYAKKQIALLPKNYIASNRKDAKYHYYLSDAPIIANEVIKHGAAEVSKEQFYDIWNEYSKELFNKWKLTKENFPVGSVVEGSIEIFYPQGVIFSITEDVIGLADYNKCRDSTRPDNLYPGHKVRGIVNGYDEENMWLYRPQLIS
ncbi:hypothetical protein [Cohnella sp. GCM10012308]|uniref:hypothetical protein n=1 Tax=Cohnella sp. GCM10012308 TaxID=3317329 RepID=UPI003620D28B